MRLLALLALQFLHNPRRMKLKDGQGKLAPPQQAIAYPSAALQPQLVSNVRLMGSAAGSPGYPPAMYQGYPQMVAQSPYPQVQYSQNPIPMVQYGAPSPVPYSNHQLYYA